MYLSNIVRVTHIIKDDQNFVWMVHANTIIWKKFLLDHNSNSISCDIILLHYCVLSLFQRAVSSFTPIPFSLCSDRFCHSLTDKILWHAQTHGSARLQRRWWWLTTMALAVVTGEGERGEEDGVWCFWITSNSRNYVAYILFDHDNLHKWLAGVVLQDPFDLVHPPATIAKDLSSVPRAFTGPASAHVSALRPLLSHVICKMALTLFILCFLFRIKYFFFCWTIKYVLDHLDVSWTSDEWKIF